MPRSPFALVAETSPRHPSDHRLGQLVERQFGALLHVVANRQHGLPKLNGPSPGRAVTGSHATIVTSIAPGEILVFVPAEHVDTVHAEWAGAAAAAGGSVLDVLHGRAVLSLSGPRSIDLLAGVSSVDISRLPAGTSIRTSVAGVGMQIVVEPHDPTSFLLLVERSFGRYFEGVLIDAGQEHASIP
jgi:heterotetrameric sarcosine oxidase gamma subunit